MVGNGFKFTELFATNFAFYIAFSNKQVFRRKTFCVYEHTKESSFKAKHWTIHDEAQNRYKPRSLLEAANALGT
jgi:hypothetical protein